MGGELEIFPASLYFPIAARRASSQSPSSHPPILDYRFGLHFEKDVKIYVCQGFRLQSADPTTDCQSFRDLNPYCSERKPNLNH